MMRTLIGTILGMALIVGTAQAEFLAKGTQSIRLDYLWQDDAGQGDSDWDGVEVGVGTAVYELDDLAAVYGHMENDDFETDRLLLSAEEHYPMSWMPEQLVPFLGAGIGYGWLDIDGKGTPADDLDRSGWMARGEAGLRILFCDYFGLNLSARLNYSTHEIFPDGSSAPGGGELEDTSYDFAFGVRFFY